MRTTVTLDPDTEALVRKVMRERGLSFKDAINDAIRAGLAGRRRTKFTTRTFDLGEPRVPLTKALSLAAEMEDEEIVHELAAGK